LRRFERQVGQLAKDVMEVRADALITFLGFKTGGLPAIL
jgi:hypothetical protein